jgi:hypothetical protein
MSTMVSKGFRATIVFAVLSRLILWRQMHVLTLTKNMKLHVDPLFKLYVEYLLRVNNGQEFSIIDHFPLEVDTKPSVRVEIALYLKIHQAPSLNTLIHVVFSAMAINYANQGYVNG